jgi:hypothetical protein
MMWLKHCSLYGCLALSALFEMMMVVPNRGGAQQRLKRLKCERSQHHSREASALGTGLLVRWGEGQLSASDVQELALLAAQSGATDAEVLFLSKLGSAGTQQGNISRDLKAAYLQGIAMPDPYMVTIPLYDKSDRTSTIDVEVGVLLPHEWFSALSMNYPYMFEVLFGPSEVQKFWQNQSMQNPKFHKHPMLSKSNWQKLAVPFVLHADGAQFQERDSLLTVSFKSLLFEHGKCKDTHLLFCAVPKSITTDHTWPPLWKTLSWSFDVLLKGVHPLCDMDGNRWAEGSARAALAGKPLCRSKHVGVLWGIVGDLDFFHKDLKGPGHNSASFCWLCGCNRTTHPWTDFRPQALWRQTRLSSESVLRSTAFDCELFGRAGVSPLMLMFDVMHVMELGIVLHVIANALFTFALLDDTHRDATEAMDHIWVRLQEIYSELGLERKHASLAIKNICEPTRPNADYPVLKKYKASEVKGLLRATAQLAKERGPTDMMHQQIICAAENLVGIYDILEGDLTQTEHQKMTTLCERFLLNYSWLAKNAIEQGRFMWSIVNKFHFLVHLVEQSRWENSKEFSAYSGEDFVGRISRICHKCLPGKPTHQIFNAFLDRYLITTHLVFTRLQQ